PLEDDPGRDARRPDSLELGARRHLLVGEPDLLTEIEFRPGGDPVVAERGAEKRRQELLEVREVDGVVDVSEGVDVAPANRDLQGRIISVRTRPLRPGAG